ncbi:hypothetical protein [Kosakonia cowanii]|uniref:hypothetical protein n=1 Tax=Kosakonia cowanii TaxID=208223 RepID=UPI004063A55B
MKWQVIYTNRENSPFKMLIPLRKTQPIKEIIGPLTQVKNFSLTAQIDLATGLFLLSNQPKPLT